MAIFNAPRITTAQRNSLTLSASEVVFDTNEKIFYGGDGSTVGGFPIGSGSSTSQTVVCRNNTGSTVAQFRVVYINGALGNEPTIQLAIANTDPTSSKTFGITKLPIANNTSGVIVHSGEIDDLNTSAFADGDLLWLSPTTAGALTNVRPSSPNHAVFIGYVIRSHPTLGKIIVTIQNGLEIGELHDVEVSLVADNQVLKYDAPNLLWKNETLVKGDVGLGDVPNVDATNPANIVQTSSYRFVSDTEKGVWSGKQNALGFTPENVANKETNFAANTGSDIKYPTIKSIFTWIVGVLSGYQPNLGFDPANDTLSNLGSTAVNNPINPDSNISHTLGASGLNWLSLATQSVLYDDSPNIDVQNRKLLDIASKDALDYDNRHLLDKSAALVLDWDNCIIDQTRFGLTGVTFETVSKNLRQYNYTLTYTTGVLTKITYVVPSVGDITKTLNYTSGLLTSVVLSGSTPASIQLTKTLTYTSGVLTSIAYT